MESNVSNAVNGDTKQPFLIGVAGGTASGKVGIVVRVRKDKDECTCRKIRGEGHHPTKVYLFRVKSVSE